MKKSFLLLIIVVITLFAIIRYAPSADSQVFPIINSGSNDKTDIFSSSRIIPIIDAELFDSNGINKKNVFDLVRSQDNSTIVVPNNGTLRVKFAQLLDNSRDITLYAKSRNSTGGVAVYNLNSNKECARLSGLAQYAYYKINLSGLIGKHDVFDLVSIGDLEYDYVVDPSPQVAYIWDSFENEEHPELLDGDINTTTSYLFTDNYSLIDANGARYRNRGYLKILLSQREFIPAIKIVQKNSWYALAKMVTLKTDDGTLFTYDLSADLQPVGSYSNSTLNLNKTTSWINVYINQLNNSNWYGPRWGEVEILANLSEMPLKENVNQTSVLINFSHNDGNFRGGFGAIDTQAYVGIPQGWEFSAMDAWAGIKPFIHRTFIGDEYPHNFGYDKLPIAVLAEDINSNQTIISLVDASQIRNGENLQIGYEYLDYVSLSGNNLTVNRNYSLSTAAAHRMGDILYRFDNAAYIGRATQLLPEYPMILYRDGINSNIPVNATKFNVSDGTFVPGDVILIQQEKMNVTAVNGNELTVERLFDGTETQAAYWSGGQMHKILNYSMYYQVPPVNASQESSYYWDYWDAHFDQIILDMNISNVLVITESPYYMFFDRGNVSSINQNNLTDINKNWWDSNSSTSIARSEFYNGHLFMLNGAAKGKEFCVLSHSDNTLSLVNCSNESIAIDLVGEGVSIGDYYRVRPQKGKSETLGAPSRYYWQQYADFWYMNVKHLTERYPDTTFYFEFWNEPNLYGQWTGNAYIELYQLLSNTIRTGGINFGNGLLSDKIKLGAGSASTGIRDGGLNSGIGAGNYLFYERLIRDCEYLDFLSYHDYGNSENNLQDPGDKRSNSYDASIIRRFAAEEGKSIEIINSEHNACAAGAGTGAEEATNISKVIVPYWGLAFINDFYGQDGEEGRQLANLAYRMMTTQTGESFGLFSNGKVSASYWVIKLFSEHVNSSGSDIFAKVIQSGDPYGWIQTMAITKPDGTRRVFIVNSKNTSILINLSMEGLGIVDTAQIYSVIGFGENTTVPDGYLPLDTEGIIDREISGFDSLIIEPASFNVISIQEENTNTPPDSVTNLRVVSSGTTGILWDWTNPSNADFNSTIIFLNGLNIVNLSAPINYYNATMLSPNTNYTLKIWTTDNNGNVNDTDVEIGSYTLVETPVIEPIINSPRGSGGGSGASIFCGDNICSLSENCSKCAKDCGECAINNASKGNSKNNLTNVTQPSNDTSINNSEELVSRNIMDKQEIIEQKTGKVHNEKPYDIKLISKSTGLILVFCLLVIAGSILVIHRLKHKQIF